MKTMEGRLAGVSPWARAVAAILSALVLVDCGSDRPTGPAGSQHRPDVAASHTITSLGTYSIPIPPDNTNSYAICCNYTTTSGAQSMTGTGIVIPAGSLYRVRVHGTVTVSPNPAHQAAYPNNPDYSASGTYGPGGLGSYGQLLVLMQLHNTDGSGTVTVNLYNPQGGAGGPDTASTPILYATKAAELWVGRVGIGGSTNDNCCHWNIGDYALTASQTVTVEQLTNFVHVTATPAFVHSGQQVTFKVDNDDGTPQAVNGWTWTRDPGTNANPPNGCFWAINPCTAAVFGSGTMTASTNYGAPSAHVTVYTNFTLDADNTSPHWGDSVTFTPKYDGVAGPAARWRWVPDDSATHDTSACPPSTSSCKKAVTGSGTMWAYTASTVGQGDSASKHVTVTCAVGDSILDSASVRRGLDSALTASSPDSVTWKRGEQAGYIIRNADGSLSTIPLDLTTRPAYSFPCVWGGANFPVLRNIVGFYHTHPFTPGEWAFCNGPSIPGLVTADSEQYTPFKNGGGSNIDWSALKFVFNLARDSANFPRVPMYIVDKANWYRMDPGIEPSDGPNHLKFWVKRPLNCH